MFALIICTFALSSCGSKTLHISADRCWSLAAGDKVEGTAVLFAYKGDGCIECGASVSGKGPGNGCPQVPLTITDEAVVRAYDRVVRSSPEIIPGFVQPTIFVTGEVLPYDGKKGALTIRATQLRIAKTGGS